MPEAIQLAYNGDMFDAVVLEHKKVSKYKAIKVNSALGTHTLLLNDDGVTYTNLHKGSIISATLK